MIVVVAQPPLEGASDGMLQRIVAVDRLLGGEDRVYLSPRLDPLRVDAFELRELRPGVRVGEPNLFDRAHVAELWALGRAARAMIVHSLHWARTVLPLYELGHVITDLHGVVPEEQRLLGHSETAALFDRIEPVVVRKSRLLVTVSDAMAEHLRAKYAPLNTAMLKLPVVSTRPEPATTDRALSDSVHLLYAGGMHCWQNVPRMIQAVSRMPVKWTAEFLTPDVNVMRQQIEAHGLENRVEVHHAGPSELAAAYRRAHYAFVLRDDHVVNRVACPTKLQEALASGAVPITLSRAIGDFERLGYQTVSVEQLERGDLPDEAARSKMARHNRDVFVRLAEQAVDAGDELARVVRDAEPPRNGELAGALWGEVLLERLDSTRARVGQGAPRHLFDVVRYLRSSTRRLASWSRRP